MLEFACGVCLHAMSFIASKLLAKRTTFVCCTLISIIHYTVLLQIWPNSLPKSSPYIYHSTMLQIPESPLATDNIVFHVQLLYMSESCIRIGDGFGPCPAVFIAAAAAG